MVLFDTFLWHLQHFQAKLMVAKYFSQDDHVTLKYFATNSVQACEVPAVSNGCSAWRALGTAKTVTRVLGIPR